MSLRLRLTLWYSTVLAGVIFLFGVIVYTILSASLIGQIDLSLKAAAEDIIRASSVSQVLDIQIVNIPPDLDRFGGPNVYAQVWKTDGTLVNQSGSIGAYSEPFDAYGLAESYQSRRDAVVRGVHLRVFTLPIITSGGTVVGYVQTASPLRTVDVAKSILLIVLVGGGVGAVALAALIGWFSARRALAPLETITQTALQITRADDLSRRIPMAEPPQDDEVNRLRMAFNESLERLEKLFNAQRRFLADVSHELRTPLTAIRGNVDLMRRMGEADSTSLDAIQSEAERMSRLVGDLLLLAQAESGSLPLAHDLVELDTLLLEVCSEAQVLAAGVTVGIGEIDQAVVVGDRDRLKQVILNLVSNALKFTPEGGRVTMGLALAAGQWVRLTVTDTGMGIPPGELSHIFDRFYRVDKARSRTLGGAGLGLSIAKRIVHMHGGRIEASSEGIPGRGATFSVWLPLSQARSPAETRKPVERKQERA